MWRRVGSVVSRSDPAQRHQISENDRGELGCDCPAWRFGKGRPRRCRHTDAWQAAEPASLAVEQADLRRISGAWDPGRMVLRLTVGGEMFEVTAAMLADMVGSRSLSRARPARRAAAPSFLTDARGLREVVLEE